jgi:anti-sigma-K factor RskA
VSDPLDTGPAHERYADDLAAYALGALEKGEAEELRRHLEDCDACRRQLRWLQPAVDLLPTSVPQREPPPRLRKRLMATVRRESRRSARADRAHGRRLDLGAVLARPATAAAAAAVILAVGAATGYLLHGSGSETSEVVARGLGPGSDVRGTLERQDGSAILRVQGMPRLARGEVYETWVRRGDNIEPSSLFVVQRDRSGAAAIPGPLEGASAVLVTREPIGGSPRPTTPPVLRAPVPQ